MASSKTVEAYLALYRGNVSQAFAERLKSMTDHELRCEFADLVKRRAKAEQHEKWLQVAFSLGDGLFSLVLVLRRIMGMPCDKGRVVPTASIGIPKLGEYLICAFVSLEKQPEKLGDMEECFTNIWLPRFGARPAKLIYVWHAFGCATRVAKGAAIAWAAGKVLTFVQSLR